MIKDFLDIVKTIKDKDLFMINDMDLSKEVSKALADTPFIMDSDVRIPYIIIKSKLPKDFIQGYLGINEDMINTEFSCLDYTSYLLDCDKYVEDKCDIIDIANEEMEKIDSSEIDKEFDKVQKQAKTQKIIDKIAANRCTPKDLKEYYELLDDKRILELRVEGRGLYLKVDKKMSSDEIKEALVFDGEVEYVPIRSSTAFYRIDCRRFSLVDSVPLYDPREFKEELVRLGNDGVSENIQQQVRNALSEAHFEYDTLGVNIEDRVLAIGVSPFVPDAKEIFSDVLGINPQLFIEVSTVSGTVILIDTRRWVLERDDFSWLA